MLPPKDRLTICFAHVAYQLQERFLLRKMGLKSVGVRTADDFEQAVVTADVVVVSSSRLVRARISSTGKN
jgi:D-2-hydroxyacid dehydrogenase (NADP+)